MVPVSISDIEFVNSYGSTQKDSELVANSTVAILKVTADTWSNTDAAGGDLDLKLHNLVLDESLGTNTTVASYEIEKINGSESAIAGTVAGGQVTFNVAGSSNDFVLEAGEVAYFKVEAQGVTFG